MPGEEVDRIFQELVEIHDKLNHSENLDAKLRADLRDRQRALRHAAANLPLHAASREALRRELAQLVLRRNELLERRPNIAAMGDGGEGQGGMADLQEWVWQIDKLSGIAEIKSRINEIERRLSDPY